jgi:hypothetical protein
MGQKPVAPEPGRVGNPFIYNAPVRSTDFCNREKIIDKLLHETVTGKSQGNVWITGERQVGKTSLLRYIQSKYEHYDKKIRLYPEEEYFNVAFIYLNVQDTKSRDDFYQNLRQSLKNFFDFKIETTDDAYKDYIHALKYLYVEQKYYIVFLVDEFDAFVEHLAADEPKPANEFLAELNKLIQGVSDIKNEPKIFSCIFAANHTIEELVKENHLDRRGSGLVLESIELEWFTRKQVEELAQHYLENNSIGFSAGDIDSCFKMTQGYPYFVQKLFSIIYEQKSRNPGSKSYLSEVEKSYGKMFKETVNGWGGANMPKRTLEKLKDLSGKILKNIGDKSLDVLFKGIETYLKTLI